MDGIIGVIKMYQLVKNLITNSTEMVKRLEDNLYIPFAPDNTDYIVFKRDVSNSVDINDANGIPLTNQQKRDLYATLP
jgi:hypothetical protein